MDDWEYCHTTLPKVSRTFALNIRVLEGDLHRSVLVAYLFCRIVDTVEDATVLDPKIKIRLLHEFARLMEDEGHRSNALTPWVEDCKVVDGSENDLELLANTERVFRVFEALPKKHQEQIIPSVAEMARGMAWFQKQFDYDGLTVLKDVAALENYCYYVAGVVGEMLCNLFFQALPGLSPTARDTMKNNAVSFGLGLQMTNISKDFIVDRGRGWSYIPEEYIKESGLTPEEFSSNTDEDKNLEVLSRLLNKTQGHLDDALAFTLAIPRSAASIRLFCILPLWMAVETVAVLHNNRKLLRSDDPVKISRATVRRIIRRMPLICFSNTLLSYSFNGIRRRAGLNHPPGFQLKELKARLSELDLKEPFTDQLTAETS